MNELADLSEQQTEIDREIQKIAHKKFEKFYEERRSKVKQIPSFWLTCIRACPEMEDYVGFEDDELLESLTDLYVKYEDTEEEEKFSISFEFDPENEFLETVSLVKPFKFVEKTIDGKKVRKLISEPVKLKWKKHKNLVKKSERSFFRWFSYTGEGPGEFKNGESVALILSDVLFADALKLFSEGMQNELEDLEDEYDLDEEDDDAADGNAEDQGPSKKKVKKE